MHKEVLKVLVTGGRDYTDRLAFVRTMDALAEEFPDKEIFIIEGGMTGLDTLAKDWARMRGHPCAEIKAHWHYYGDSAGPIRNRWMLMLEPDLVVAFPGGRGTANMVKQAKAWKIEVREIERV